MIRIIKQFITIIAYHFGLWNLLFLISGLIKKKKILTIFTFHRITDPACTNDFILNYDKGLDRETYEMHIKAILKYFDVISEDEFLSIILGHKDIKRHSALITFDDADSDFVPNALPVLKKYNCPSVIFAPTNYIDSNNRFWHLRVSNLFKKLDDSKWKQIQTMNGLLPDNIVKIIKSLSVSNNQLKARACQEVVNALDMLEQNVIDSVIVQMEKVTNTDYVLGIKCMNWDELRGIQRNNVVVESHAVEHNKLAEQTPDKIKQELTNSKDILESKLGCSIQTICYPAGSFDNDVLRIAEETKYKAGYTTLPGRCFYPREGEYLYRLPRYTIYGEDKYSTHQFMGKIALESITDE